MPAEVVGENRGLGIAVLSRDTRTKYITGLRASLRMSGWDPVTVDNSVDRVDVGRYSRIILDPILYGAAELYKLALDSGLTKVGVIIESPEQQRVAANLFSTAQLGQGERVTYLQSNAAAWEYANTAFVPFVAGMFVWAGRALSEGVEAVANSVGWLPEAIECLNEDADLCVRRKQAGVALEDPSIRLVLATRGVAEFALASLGWRKKLFEVEDVLTNPHGLVEAMPSNRVVVSFPDLARQIGQLSVARVLRVAAVGLGG